MIIMIIRELNYFMLFMLGMIMVIIMTTIIMNIITISIIIKHTKYVVCRSKPAKEKFCGRRTSSRTLTFILITFDEAISFFKFVLEVNIILTYQYFLKNVLPLVPASHQLLC